MKVYPSGKASVYPERRVNLSGNQTDRLTVEGADNLLCVAAHGIEKTMTYLAGDGPPLSLDKGAKSGQPPKQNGLKGMQRKTQRRVHEQLCCFERLIPKELTTFGTVTFPDLGPELNEVLYTSFNTFVSRFMKELKRELQRHGLPLTMLAVLEIQPKRYERTGEPYLHIHYVHQGRLKGETWVVTTEWVRRLVKRLIENIVANEVPLPVVRLEQVKKSVASYLGKYMSKGGEMVNKAVEDGFVGWIPKQWYRSTRDLVQEVRKRTAVMEDSDGAFLQSAAERDPNVWDFVTDVSIELENGVTRVLAYFGQLSDKVQGALGVGKFHQGLPLKA
jgi:hypothetical protein